MFDCQSHNLRKIALFHNSLALGTRELLNAALQMMFVAPGWMRTAVRKAGNTAEPLIVNRNAIQYIDRALIPQHQSKTLPSTPGG